MRKTAINFVVDALAFAGFVLLVATGLVERYVLPPGSGSLEGFGAGYRAAERPVILLWGLTRHQWGQIHFWIAISLMAILAVHLFLHWRWIACVVQGKPREGSGMRLGLGIVGLMAVLTVAVAPFVSPTETVPRSQLGEGPPSDPREQGVTNDIRGSMTLREVEQATGVPVEYVMKRLGLPQKISPDERLEKLRRLYGVKVEDVRRVVAEYQKRQ